MASIQFRACRIEAPSHQGLARGSGALAATTVATGLLAPVLLAFLFLSEPPERPPFTVALAAPAPFGRKARPVADRLLVVAAPAPLELVASAPGSPLSAQLRPALPVAPDRHALVRAFRDAAPPPSRLDDLPPNAEGAVSDPSSLSSRMVELRRLFARAHARPAQDSARRASAGTGPRQTGRKP